MYLRGGHRARWVARFGVVRAKGLAEEPAWNFETERWCVLHSTTATGECVTPGGSEAILLLPIKVTLNGDLLPLRRDCVACVRLRVLE
jgi:hypothetical protein